ncbi:MAG TPA: peptidoglycan DD-metalloendopeptidase family protein [Candidatus Egerieimonas intestinavium]|uniref:Peptidoglycan DD-metalloendopeptidase family protein n=1 Tax=Candidatus Egerieimonas intestinavium TaxID=2840777 RepID=A0A9D1EHK3_9FIRM|nr:peptidoglycan DD-metalloendopeptidase family protein [Candidatus Egerieimonas intestinavium]
MMKKERFTRIAASSILALAVVAAGVTMYRSEVNKKDQEIQEQEMLPEGDSPQEETAKHTEEDAKEQENASGTQESSGTEASSAQAAPEENAGESAADVSGNGVVQETPETAAAPEDVTAGTEDTAAVPQEDAVQDTSSAQVENSPQLNFSDGTVISWPVNGTPVIDYSMDATVYFPTLDVYKYSPAMVLGAPEGSPVYAACAGTVTSITEDAEVGTLMTVDLGNGYQALYGQLKDVTVEAGQTLAEGQQLGAVAAPTKYYAEEGSNLYFAMTKDGQPVDPTLYLAPLTE